MSGSFLWVIRAFLLTASFAISPSSGMADAIPKEYAAKATAALRLWEYDRDEYLKLTRLTTTQRKELEDYLRRADRRDEKLYHGVALLVALNCGQIPEGASVYLAVQRYRCAGEPLAYLSSHAIIFGNFYLYAFVKPEDCQRTIDFLGRYLEFWQHESARGEKGMPPGGADLLAIAEVQAFLERGGYLPVR